MKLLPRWLPASLAHRFALAAAGLAVAALLLTSGVSWWLIQQQHDHALQELAARERQFRAAAVGTDLRALAARMAEIAGSTILATGLVDSAGRETYLVPFLSGVRQINGIPVQVMFTDFQGQEIASNGGARFTSEQVGWLRSRLEEGRPAARIFEGAQGPELVAMEPMVYARTSSPEGAVLYKAALRDLKLGPGLQLEWGPPAEGRADGAAAPVPVPPVFEALQFRVRGDALGPGATRPALPLLHILVITLGLFSVVVVAGVRLARLLTHDLQRLEGFARGLLGSGLNTERAPEGGSAEITSLARSINEMLERLNQQHLALLHEQDKLTQLTEALQEADRKKDAFLAMLGHELRNPLAPISAGAELLRKIPAADPRVVRTSEVIARQVGHMTKIVSDLLDVSRVTRGLIRLERTEVDMAAVVNAAVEQLRPLIEQHRHTVSVSLPQEPAVVLGDHARLVQVVGNLLANAAKYTPEGGRIEVRLDTLPSDVQVVVQDNGMGIAPELMPDLFELFTQGSRAADRSQGGLGLGLALVKHLVQLHGGVVQAASDGPERGAAFTIRLPRLLAPLDLAQDEPAHEPPERPLHILVVDDNVDAANMLAHWLTLEGHSVVVAHEGRSALEHAARETFEAFILDIGLPGMDGTELARRLRVGGLAKDALLVALTGYGQASDREKSTAAGFDHHLVKPADPQQLRDVLAKQARAPATV
jgi:signal transduction histidine kinase/CheY-like chemotaxis protein